MAAELRVLVVDDEATIRVALARFLRSRGCTVFEAANGVDALAWILTTDVGIVISDLSMPTLDGATLWERACRARPALTGRWLFVSALPLPALLVAAGERHLAKPFDLEAVWREACALGGQRPPGDEG